MSETSQLGYIRPLVLSAVFSALIAAGAYLQIVLPITPVPITLQTLFVLLAALVLGPRWALSSVMLYLLVGLIGLPVFAGGGRGFTSIIGPTGGFLLGFIPAAFLTAVISKTGKEGSQRKQLIIDVFALLAGTLTIYAVGYPWLVLNVGMDWRIGLGRAVIPFLPGDALKIVAAAALAPLARKLLSTDA